VDEVLFEHKIIGNWVRLYRNRVEFQTGAPLGKTQTILLKNVSDISTGFGRNMMVHSTGGKKHSLPISGNAAEKLKAQIMGLL
jgi:hypothetical protein